MTEQPSHTPAPAEQPAPGAGRRRLLAALKRPASRAQVTVAVLLAVLGFAAVVQVQANGRDDRYVGARQGELIALINNLSLASQRAEQEITQLEQTRNSLENDTKARRTALDRAKEQADTLAILAGTIPAVGPGIRITVTDPSHTVGTQQLLNGLEELRDAGAEAIEINDTVRVVAQTSLRDAPSGGVIVDGTKLEAPYTIEVIGESHTLATALNFSGGFNFEVHEAGGKAGVEQLDNVEVASVVAPPKPKYADPVPAR
jgi:uncharacterized protein YlxW (UPF0749 family)